MNAAQELHALIADWANSGPTVQKSRGPRTRELVTRAVELTHQVRLVSDTYRERRGSGGIPSTVLDRIFDAVILRRYVWETNVNANTQFIEQYDLDQLDLFGQVIEHWSRTEVDDASQFVVLRDLVDEVQSLLDEVEVGDRQRDYFAILLDHLSVQLADVAAHTAADIEQSIHQLIGALVMLVEPAEPDIREKMQHLVVRFTRAAARAFFAGAGQKALEVGVDAAQKAISS